MKILIPILGFGKSGGYRTLSKLANEWIRLGAEVSFLVPASGGLPYFRTDAGIIRITGSGKFMLSHDPSENEDNTGFIYTQKALFYGLRKLANDYDVYLANHSLTVFPMYLAGLQKKSLYYVQAYEPEYYELMGGLRKRMLKYFSMLSYRLGFKMVVNAAIYKSYKKIKSDDVVLPGLDLSLFKPNGSTSANHAPDVIRLGTVGRLEKFKGSGTVLSAFRELKKAGHRVELHVAFGTAEQWQTEGEEVYFHLPGNDAELADFYRSVDIYVCAGSVQFGAVHYPVIESMACGISLITTPYYPASPSNCYLTEQSDAREITKAFENFLADDAAGRERKKIEALRDVQEFEWKSVGSKMYMCLKQVVNHARS